MEPLYQLLLRIIDMQKQSQQSGFSLLELIVVIILLGILIAGSTNSLVIGANAFFTGQNVINTNWHAGIALERMTRDLRAIRSTNDIATAAANSISITDLYGNTITYQVSNGQLQRTYNGTAEPLANNVQSITLAYYNSGTTPTLLTPLPLSSSLIAQINYILITLSMSCNNISFSVITMVDPWNIN